MSTLFNFDPTIPSDNYTLKELKNIGKDYNIKGYHSMKKSDIYDALVLKYHNNNNITNNSDTDTDTDTDEDISNDNNDNVSDTTTIDATIDVTNYVKDKNNDNTDIFDPNIPVAEYKLVELKKFAKDQNIKGYNAMRKVDLYNLLILNLTKNTKNVSIDNNIDGANTSFAIDADSNKLNSSSNNENNIDNSDNSDNSDNESENKDSDKDSDEDSDDDSGEDSKEQESLGYFGNEESKEFYTINKTTNNSNTKNKANNSNKNGKISYNGNREEEKDDGRVTLEQLRKTADNLGIKYDQFTIRSTLVNMIRNKLRNEEIPNDTEIDSDDDNLTEDLAFQDVTDYSLYGNIVDNNQEFSGYTTPTSRDIGENYTIQDKKTNKNISPYRKLLTSNSQNTNIPAKKLSPSRNSVLNSKISPSRNSALNSKISPSRNSALNSNLSPSRNSALNSNLSPSRNSALNSKISPSRNSALNSNISPSRNSALNSNTISRKNSTLNSNTSPIRNSSASPIRNSNASPIRNSNTSNGNLSTNRNSVIKARNSNNGDNINRIDSSLDIIKGRNKKGIDHEEIVKRNILTSALNKPSSFWNNTGNAAENNNVIQDDYLNNGTYNMRNGTLDDLTMTDDIYRNDVPIRTAMSGDRNTTAKYGSLSKSRLISDEDYDKVKVNSYENKKLSPARNGNTVSATKNKNSIYSKIAPRSTNIKSSKSNDNSKVKSITNKTYNNIINKGQNNGKNSKNALNNGLIDDDDYSKMKQSLNAINEYQKSSDITTNNVITRVSSSRAHSSNMTPRRSIVPLNEQDSPYTSNHYGNGLDYIGSTSDLYPNNYGAGNPTDMYVGDEDAKIVYPKSKK